MKATIRNQTLLVTGLNGLIRVMGFVLRILLSRFLGAEMMGIAELASGVHMMAITPLTSGLPMAIGRLTAKTTQQDQTHPLKAGLKLVRKVAFFLIPVFLLLSPWLARLTGDIRVLPSLWFTAPCILILGYSGVYNGFCYGTKRSYLPAISELTEQTLRVLLTIAVLPFLRHLTVPWLAAVPVASTMIAEIAGLALVICILRLPLAHDGDVQKWQKPILQLAVPSTITRLIHTLLRSITSIIIPARLIASGLSSSEATARLGMLSGMVLPLMMAPCIFTGALGMVMAPRLAQSDENARLCKQFLIKLFAAGLMVSVICTLGMLLVAPLFAVVVYRLPELTTLFRSASPLCLLCAVENLTNGAITSLGLQKTAVYGALPSSLAALMITWLLTAQPAFRLNGVIIGLAMGHILGILWNGFIIARWWCNQTVL